MSCSAFEGRIFGTAFLTRDGVIHFATRIALEGLKNRTGNLNAAPIFWKVFSLCVEIGSERLIGSPVCLGRKKQGSESTAQGPWHLTESKLSCKSNAPKQKMSTDSAEPLEASRVAVPKLQTRQGREWTQSIGRDPATSKCKTLAISPTCANYAGDW